MTERPHLVDKTGVPLCPEAELRDAMDDGEFWAHVLAQPDPVGERFPDDAEIAEYELNARLADPCPECGQYGACAYDIEGRPLIHVADTSDT